MRIALIAMMIGVLALPAYAQTMNGIGAGQGAGQAGRHGTGPSQQETAAAAAKKKEEQKANERAYNEALKRIPTPEKKYDPWGNVRDSK